MRAANAASKAMSYTLAKGFSSPFRSAPLWDVAIVIISAALGAAVASALSEPANRYLRTRFRTERSAVSAVAVG
jgi:hypothetical protein